MQGIEILLIYAPLSNNLLSILSTHNAPFVRAIGLVIIQLHINIFLFWTRILASYIYFGLELCTCLWVFRKSWTIVVDRISCHTTFDVLGPIKSGHIDMVYYRAEILGICFQQTMGFCYMVCETVYTILISLFLVSLCICVCMLDTWRARYEVWSSDLF